MNVSLYQAAAAMNANARWQEHISENLSATAIPGFKRQDLSFSALQAGLGTRAPQGQGPLPLPTSAAHVDFTPGELTPTGNATDFALAGPGFFEVQLPTGGAAYTRDGEFKISPEGQLVTKQGYPVMGVAGPLRIEAAAGPVQVSPAGEISQGGLSRGTLKIAQCAQPQLLTRAGAGYFLAQHPEAVMTEGDGHVRQGCLEAANTSAMSEMVNLISSLRLFEANQRVIQKQDERMGRLIAELGNPN